MPWVFCSTSTVVSQHRREQRKRESGSALYLPLEHGVQSEQPLIFAHPEDLITTLETGPDSNASCIIKHYFHQARERWSSLAFREDGEPTML